MASSLSQITGLEPRDNSDKHSKIFALITDADLKIWYENKKSQQKQLHIFIYRRTVTLNRKHVSN
jgi:hypothetical protein